MITDAFLVPGWGLVMYGVTVVMAALSIFAMVVRGRSQ